MSLLTQKARECIVRAAGISRVARITGLDRTGVEVACAVRPRGHVLQVSNGKGEEASAAEHGAILEAAELWGAETVDATRLIWGSVEELARAAPEEVWPPGDLGSAGSLAAPGLAMPGTRLAWCAGTELHDGSHVLVPAQALHCPPAGSPPLGPALVRWTTNGMGAHPHRESAVLHALLEAIERDQLARALPDGWTGEAVADRLLAREQLCAIAPRTAARAAAIAQGRFEVRLFDLSPKKGGLRLPVAGALLIDLDEGPVPLTAGYGCALTWDGALLGALLEAAQSRLTDIHGAREDVAASESEAIEWLRDACAQSRPRRRIVAAPDIRGGHEIEAILDVLGRRGHARAAAFDLTPDATAGVHVIKVVIPGLSVSELL